MIGIIRIGDKTSGGGKVQSGSNKVKFGGIGIARKGDSVSCPQKGHSPSFIAEGHPTMSDEGIPIAFHGYKCTCGCTLISSMGNATTSK